MLVAGRTAVVTAGGNGIGRSVCAALAGRGVNVVIADLDGIAAERAAGELRAAGGSGIGVACDVRDESALEAVRDAAEREFGPVDLLVNHAGGAVHGPVDQVPVSDWAWLLDLNVVSMVRGLRVFLPPMMAAGSGHVVFTTSSLALLSGHPHAGDVVPYVTSKGAVIALAQSVHMYLAPRGIGVTLFAPDYTDTGFPLSARRVGVPAAQGAPKIPYPPQTPDQAAQVLVAALEEKRFLASATPGVARLLALQASAVLDPSELTPRYDEFAEQRGRTERSRGTTRG